MRNFIHTTICTFFVMLYINASHNRDIEEKSIVLILFLVYVVLAAFCLFKKDNKNKKE